MVEKKRVRATLRRWTNENQDHESDEETEKPRKKKHKVRRTQPQSTSNKKFEGELTTTSGGLLKFENECWKKMDEKEKVFVREFNAAVRHGEPVGKINIPSGVTVKVRRMGKAEPVIKEESKDDSKKKVGKRKKGVNFGLTDEDHVEDY
jgi:hypothetical protein